MHRAEGRAPCMRSTPGHGPLSQARARMDAVPDQKWRDKPRQLKRSARDFTFGAPCDGLAPSNTVETKAEKRKIRQKQAGPTREAPQALR